MLIDTLKSFFAGLVEDGGDRKKGDFAPDDVRVAAAALMYHVIQADGVLRPVERERFERILREEHDLDAARLKSLMEAARQADSDAVDLYRFTSVMMGSMEHEQRVHFIEVLWELVYSDGERHELEDNVVWRIAELLAVERADRIAARQRVSARLGGRQEQEPDGL